VIAATIPTAFDSPRKASAMSVAIPKLFCAFSPGRTE